MRRATWTDERLDDLAQHIDERFEQVDRRFEQVDRRFDRVDDSIRHLTMMLMWTAGGIIAALVGAIGAVALNGDA
jgi:hypothetical protein